MKNEPAIINFGKRLAKLRKANGLTQQQLGDKVGVSKRVIAYYEGETKYPPAHLIVPIAKAFNITTDQLLNSGKLKSTVDPKLSALWRRLKTVETFSEKDKKTVLRLIEVIIEKNKAQHAAKK
jgi:transcriptional regulator with XRE-family HTH domain